MSRLPTPYPQRTRANDELDIALIPDAARETPAWRYDLDLTDPRQAYAAGCVDGYLRRCAEEDAENDQAHREAVRQLIRSIDQADARRAADRGESSEGRRAA